MFNKKMTEEEVIDTMKYCLQQGITSECEKCKMKGRHCRTELIKYALDIIEHRGNEIEIRKSQIQHYREDIEELKRKNIVQSYKEVPVSMNMVYRVGCENAFVKSIEVSAIRGFMKRLKEFMKSQSNEYAPFDYVTARDIDNLEKEVEAEYSGK